MKKKVLLLILIGFAVLISALFLFSGRCKSIASLEKEYGIKIQGVSRIAGGNMLIFKFHVDDPEKARTLTNLKNDYFLIDQATNTKIPVTIDSKVREVRMSGRAQRQMIAPVYDHYIAFVNKPVVVREGSRVTVKVGDFKACNLIVQ